MAVNQKNITIASFNYLTEISAVPPEIRGRYLEKLLGRKNAASQKNVKLLKCIYFYVDENRISEWNPDEVCRLAGLNMNALYIQKSRLLKGLREYFFRWKETEREIEARIERNYESAAFYIEGEKTNALMLEKARKMAETGMMREAKIMYMKLEKATNNSNLDRAERYLILSEIYEFLSYYYFNKRQKRKLFSYTVKLDKISEIINKFNIKVTEEQMALLNIRLNYSGYYYYGLAWYANSKVKMESNYSQTIYSLSKEIKNYYYLFKILHSRAILELTKENIQGAKDICTEGYNTACEQKNLSAQYTFASMLYYIKTKETTDPKLNNNNILRFYHKIKNSKPFHLWTLYLENSIVMMYYPEKRKEILDIFREQIASNIMFGDLAFSVYWKFMLDSEKYNDKLISYFNIYNVHFKGYLEIKKVDDNILDDIKKICLNTECYHTKINDFGLSWLVLRLKLISYYFREDGYEFEDVLDLLKAMEQLKRKSKNMRGLKTYELLKIALKMLEHSIHPKYMLSRYELKFKRITDGYKENPSDISIIDYAIISSLARRLNCREITAIVKEFYMWLKDKHPGILSPVFREIEERQARIKLFDGSKGAA